MTNKVANKQGAFNDIPDLRVELDKLELLYPFDVQQLEKILNPLIDQPHAVGMGCPCEARKPALL